MPTSTPIAPAAPGQDQVPPAEPELQARGAGDPSSRAVLVGVDGSECALAAVRWAAEEAQRRNAPLRILHAAPYLGRRLEPGSPSPELPRARRITGAAYTVARHTAPTVQAETEVVADEPAKALLAEARSAQLVVLGIATTGAADELVLAPVAERVVSRSGTPVVVVPRSRTPVSGNRPVTAVLGLGDPDDEERVVTFAAEVAQRTGAPLTIVRSRGHGEQPDGAWAERHPDVRTSVQDLPGGGAADLLLAVGPSPLLVLSAGHGNLLHRMLDGPHRYLLRHCTSPMAILPGARRQQDELREEVPADS